MNQLQILLERVKLINFKFKEILKNNQDAFNVFSLLRNEADEEHLHSKFIAELLDPKGSHNMGSVFQELFINVIDQNEVFKSYSASSSIVKTEFNCGSVCNDTPKGGFLDILITSDKFKIGIENKIYAPDQLYQMIRYLHFIEKGNSLFYLTLDGKDPDSCSTEFEKEHRQIKLKSGVDFMPISYAYHILNWLELCKEKAIDHPTLRETIKQYVLLIKNLTGQNLNSNYSMEIASHLLENKENLRMGHDIAQSMTQAKIKVQTLFWESLKHNIEVNGFEINENMVDIKKKIDSYYTSSRNNKDYGLSFNILNYDGIDIAVKFELTHNIRMGFVNPANSGNYDCSQNRLICEAVHSIDSNFKSDYWWFGVKYTSYDKGKLNFLHFNSDEIFSLVNTIDRQIITKALVDEAVKDIKILKNKIEEGF